MTVLWRKPNGANLLAKINPLNLVAPLEDESAQLPRMRSLSLHFVDPETERLYSDHLLERSLPITRFSILFGTLIYSLFGILDVIIIDNNLEWILAIRYFFICPMLLGLLLFTFSPAFNSYAKTYFSIVTTLAGLGIIAMTAVADPPGSYLYYAGLLVVIIYCTTLNYAQFANTAVINTLLVLTYEIVAIYINPIPTQILISNSAFLGISVMITTFSNYALEIYMRRSFAVNHLLRAEKRRSEELLAEAQAANNAKSEFLAVMSHELRTPLNAIIGFSEVMKEQMFGPLGNDRYHSYVGDIYDSGKHLLSIINDILDLSKAESGKLTLDESDVDLAHELVQIYRIFEQKAQSENITLLHETGGDLPVISGDLRLIRQVMINLLSNAVKFTPEGGRVVTMVEASPDGACLVKITDTGIGIAEEDLEDVLKPFVQVESAFARQHEGTGLGLPLVKKIMELHDGSLRIDSELGQGTSVTARFPPDRCRPPDPIAADVSGANDHRAAS